VPPARLSPADLFPDADFRHKLRLTRGPAAEFFGPWSPPPPPTPGDTDTDTAIGSATDTQQTPHPSPLLVERRHWLRTEPSRHAPVRLPEAAPLIRETTRLAAAWGAAPADDCPDPYAAWIDLAGQLEPDLVLLARQPSQPRFVMVAGAVCFPSAWAPETKLGLTLDAIHAVVPGLNAELGAPIDAFLDRLRPGPAWFRSNWGLAASTELNHHPARELPRLRWPMDPDSIQVRLEHQALLALPDTGGILFGIRVELIPLEDFRRDPLLAAGLARALRSMPEPLARYKGLGDVRPRPRTKTSCRSREARK
jgi:hypothetical protein